MERGELRERVTKNKQGEETKRLAAGFFFLGSKKERERELGEQRLFWEGKKKNRKGNGESWVAREERISEGEKGEIFFYEERVTDSKQKQRQRKNQKNQRRATRKQEGGG